MDSKVTVPLFAVECALQLHQQYRLVSLGGLARGTISVCIASDAITVVTMIFVDSWNADLSLCRFGTLCGSGCWTTS